MARYRKAVVAWLGAMVATGQAIGPNNPWVISIVSVATAILVVLTPNAAK